MYQSKVSECYLSNENVFRLPCLSLDHRPNTPDHVKHGGKIFMPNSLLLFYSSREVEYPLQFQITNGKHKAYCGVLEFTSTEGFIYLPQWMLDQLKLKENDKAFVQYHKAAHGKLIRFQAHTSDFLDIHDHKTVLEKVLVNFACLSASITIPIKYGSKTYYGDIVACQPENVISIVNCDLEVDFLAPKDYIEPKSIKDETITHHTENEFQSFSGHGVRLRDNVVNSIEVERKVTHVTRQRGIPNFNYKPGFITFPQTSFKSIAIKDDKVLTYVPFQGKGCKSHVLK
jgi:ubiquitin fusion degradation protein 1